MFNHHVDVPYSCIGSLIVMYEHKIFVQGCIWGINSFGRSGFSLQALIALVLTTSLIRVQIRWAWSMFFRLIPM